MLSLNANKFFMQKLTLIVACEIKVLPLDGEEFNLSLPRKKIVF